MTSPPPLPLSWQALIIFQSKWFQFYFFFKKNDFVRLNVKRKYWKPMVSNVYWHVHFCPSAIFGPLPPSLSLLKIDYLSQAWSMSSELVVIIIRSVIIDLWWTFTLFFFAGNITYTHVLAAEKLVLPKFRSSETNFSIWQMAYLFYSRTLLLVFGLFMKVIYLTKKKIAIPHNVTYSLADISDWVYHLKLPLLGQKSTQKKQD